MIALFNTACTHCRRVIAMGETYATLTGHPGKFHVRCVAPTPNANPSPSQPAKVPQKTVASKKQYNLGYFEKPLLVPDGLSYLPYQVEGIRHMLPRTATLLGDEMGLGKTIQAIGLLNQFPETRHVAIVTPTSLRFNWIVELKQWLKVDNRIIGLWPEADLFMLDFAVIPYSQLEGLPSNYMPEWLILDEAHYVKNPEAIRTKWLRKLAKRCPKKLFLSGSPIENRVKELFTLLQMLDPETWDPPGYVKGMQVPAGEGGGWIRFAKRHCGGRLQTHFRKVINGKLVEKKHFVFDGSTNLEELNGKLRASGLLLRRLKKDVLKDLPDKRRQLIVLPPPTDGSTEREHHAFAATGLDYASDLNVLNKASVEFETLSKARREVGLSKFHDIVAHIEDCFENNPDAPIVFFCHHKDLAYKIADEFIIRQPAVITGDTPEALRHQSVTRFQEGKTSLFIGTTGAAGVGITLTRSSHLIFGEIEWKDMSQAEDRIHRIGQKNAALIQYLVYDWSVEANMIKLVWKKMGIVAKALNPVLT